MGHPVFLNTRTVITYFGLWLLIAGIHFSVFYFFYDFPLYVAAGDSFVFNVLFCIIGISMWYIVRYSLPEKNNRWNVLINHVSFFSLTLVIWYGLSYSVLNALFSDFKPYTDFLIISIPYRLVSGVLYYALLSMTYYLMIYYNNLQDKLKVESRLRELLKESELNMLRSQINPHFLFNSLNSISSLTITDPEKAREMVIKLSDFLRYSVSTNAASFTSLENEMANIRRYLEIEKVRFGEK
jgi:two-component system, LytTR family, sensor kinase